MSDALLNKEVCDECFSRMESIVSAAGDLPEDWYSAVREHIHALHSWVSKLEAECDSLRAELQAEQKARRWLEDQCLKAEAERGAPCSGRPRNETQNID